MTDAAGPADPADDLDRLSTDELRHRAFHKAERAHDVRFFWDLLRHLPASTSLAAEDASTGEIAGGLAELMALGHEWAGGDLGDLEPLVRTRFIDYLRTG